VPAHYLTDIIVLLAAAVIAVPIFQWSKLGTIPGFLVAGIILGPSGIGYFSEFDDIQHLSELGVVLLLFVIGIELKPSRFWKMRVHVFGLGGAQVVITALALTALLNYFLAVRWPVAILLGSAFALSSTAFVLQILSETKALNTPHGRPAIAVLLMQDLAVVPLLAYLSLVSQGSSNFAADVVIAFAEALFILVLIVLAARFILNPLLNLLAKAASPDIFTATALLLVLGFAGAFEAAGLSMAMGAFVAGLLIADSSFRHQITAEIEPFRSLLLGLFFMAMGMSLNVQTLLESPLLIVTALITLIALKFVILFVLARLFKIASSPAQALAYLLAQSGEFALVLFAVAFQKSLLEPALFQKLLVVVLLSMLVTPLLNLLARRALASERLVLDGGDAAEIDAETRAKSPILIAGYGRMGRRIGELFERMNVPYIAIDNKIAEVNAARASGHPVYFGEAQKPEVLRAAGAGSAPLAIVAIDNLEGAEKVVHALHSNFPHVPIFARAHNRDLCRVLRASGAQFTVSETFEASTEIAREALMLLGFETEQIELTMTNFKIDYYSEVKMPTGEIAAAEPLGRSASNQS
jgi:Kef-type K+ transport systems, membrane components